MLSAPPDEADAFASRLIRIAVRPPIDFELLFNRSPNPYMVIDRDFRYVAANEAYLAVTGATRENLIGRGVFDAFPGNPDDPADLNVQQLRASFERVLATREQDDLALIAYIIPRHTPDGVVHEERYWSASHVPLLDDRGNVTYILQHTVDVSELQHIKKALQAAEAALGANSTREQMEQGVLSRARSVQESNRVLESERRRLLTLFQQAPGFIAVLSGADHMFELANSAYDRLVGSQRSLIGRTAAEALPEVVEQGFIDLLDRVYETGQPFIGRGVGIMIQRTADAPLEQRYVDFIYQPVVEPDGGTSGIFVQGHDVTDQVEAQQALVALNESLEQRVAQRTTELEIRNRELQDFAYVASHDLQEPLRKIQSFANLLVGEKGDLLDEEGRHFAERMQASAARMSSLIRDLLTFSRITRRGLTFEDVSLDHALALALSDLEYRLRETGGTVEADPLGTVYADPLQMQQILLNLVSNALKFHRPDVPPLVRVTREEADDRFRLVVSDNGIGFEAQYAERIFAPFQRLHAQSEFEGTGMGLPIVRRIAERHGGTVEATSTPGSGSRFTVTLPKLAVAG